MKTFLSRIFYVLSYVCLSAVSAQRLCSSPPRPPNARVTLMRHNTDTALFKCAQGYEPSGGSPVVRCYNGKWSPLTLLCREKSCGNAGELTNGLFLYEGEPVLGSKAYAHCEDGFTLIGPKFTECGVEGWSKPFPKCKEGNVTLCLVPRVSNSEDEAIAREYKVGEVLRVRCRVGFQLSGAKELTCGSDGQWQPSPPQCETSATSAQPPTPTKVYTTPKKTSNVPKANTTQPEVTSIPTKPGQCGVPEKKKNSNFHLASKFSDRKTFDAGARVYYVCDIGYVQSHGSKYRRCINGRWTPLELQCRRRLCGSAGEFDNGHFEYTGVEFGDQATAVCDEGYILVGQKTKNCLSQGWDGHPPVCDAMTCDEPPEVLNAVTIGYAEAPYKYRTVVSYRCLVGKMLGPANIWCTKNGSWSSPPPQCTVITCDAPNITNGLWVDTHRGVYQYRDSLYIHCKDRFSLVGPSIITCDERGQWAPELPKCRAWENYRRW